MPGHHRTLQLVSAVLAVSLSGSAAAFAAAGTPPLMPTRDVTVLYSVQPDGAPQPQAVKVFFHGGGDLMRIDGPPGPPDGSSSGFMVMNRPNKTMVVVLNQPRIFMDVPEGQQVQSPFVLDSTMQFTPTGSATVAGVACTRYAIVAGTGKADACVTADGVVLSETGVDGQGNRGTLTAQTVSYGPIPAALFVPPPGFQRAAHPGGPGGDSVIPPGQNGLQGGSLQGLPPVQPGTP